MEVFLQNAENCIKNNESIDIIRKCLIMLDIEKDGNYIDKFLEICIKNKHKNLIKMLLQDDRDIDKFIIGLLSKHFDIEVMNIFIDHGIDIDTIIKVSFSEYSMDESNILQLTLHKNFFKEDKSYLTVYSAHYGYKRLLTKLLANGQLEEIEHALLHAIYNKQITCIKELLIYDVKINEYITDIHHKCIIGNLCKNDDSCIAMYKKRGIYPLTATIKKNDEIIFNLLLDNKANPDICNFDKSKSIINIAIENNNLNIVKTLIDDYKLSLREDPLQNKINFNKTFLPISIKTDNSSINILVAILINIVKDKYRKKYYNLLDILNYFLDKGISPNQCCPITNLSIFTALCAIDIYRLLHEEIYFELMHILIDKGANLDLGLISACNTPSYSFQFPPVKKKTNEKVIEVLLAKKANINYNEHFSPLICLL